MAQMILLGQQWRCFLHVFGPRPAPGPPTQAGHHLNHNSFPTLAFQPTCCGTALKILRQRQPHKSLFISLTQAHKINHSNNPAFFRSKCIDPGRLGWDALLTFPMVIVWGFFLFNLVRDHAKNVSGWERLWACQVSLHRSAQLHLTVSAQHKASAPATGTRWIWALSTSGCEEADLPPWLMALEPWAVTLAFPAHLTSPLFLCSSLNGATDIREFPDLKGTTSLEVL